MEITYYIDDGYAGSNGRPYRLNVNDEDIRDCETIEEVEKLVYELIDEHARQNLHPYWDPADDREELLAILAQKEEEED
jgi:hypothetical protein